MSFQLWASSALRSATFKAPFPRKITWLACTLIGNILDVDIAAPCAASFLSTGSRGNIVGASVVEVRVDGTLGMVGCILDAFDDSGFKCLIGIG